MSFRAPSDMALGSLVVASWLWAAPVQAGVIGFSDAAFDPSQYVTTFLTSPNGQTISQQADGGNSGTTPDPFRRVTTATSASVTTLHLNTGFVVDPSKSPVGSMELSIDVKAFVAFGQGMGYGFAIVQDGVVYRAGYAITGSGAGAFQWTTRTFTDLAAADFEPFGGGPARPDFTPTGTPFTLGFISSNSGGSGISAGFDNFRATLQVRNCLEDINGDGAVDFEDLNLLLTNFNTSGAGIASDIDGDGDVDFADLNRVLGLFNAEC